MENQVKEKKTYIISAFPGCGKTTAYAKLKDTYKVLDLEKGKVRCPYMINKRCTLK